MTDLHQLSQERKYYIQKVLHTFDPESALDLDRYQFNHVFAVFGFTGAGKDALIDGFLAQNTEFPFTKFVRTMTRHKRPDEEVDTGGFFIERELFDYLKGHGRFFYSYEKYGSEEFGYDTLHFIFELTRSNIIMIGGHENNVAALEDGIASIFPEIPLTTIFVNRPKEEIIKSISDRGGEREEIEKRTAFIQKEWYEKPVQPIDYFLWNVTIDDSVQKMKKIIQAELTRPR